MNQNVTLTINIDGGARGNPGPASWAYVIQHDGEAVLEENGLLGTTTNNVAEYEAVIQALAWLKKNGYTKAVIKLDSELIYRHITGAYKIRAHHLRSQFSRIQHLLDGEHDIRFVLIPREENKCANRLAQQASKMRRKRASRVRRLE